MAMTSKYIIEHSSRETSREKRDGYEREMKVNGDSDFLPWSYFKRAIKDFSLKNKINLHTLNYIKNEWKQFENNFLFPNKFTILVTHSDLRHIPSLRLIFSMLGMLAAEAPRWSSVEPVEGVLLVLSLSSDSSELLSASLLSSSFLTSVSSQISAVAFVVGSTHLGTSVMFSFRSTSMKCSIISLPWGNTLHEYQR